MCRKSTPLTQAVCKYPHSAYSQSSFLFYGDSVIKFCEETEQGDPESPALFSHSIQDLIDRVEKNLWYLNDGYLSDDYRTVLKYLKKTVEAEKHLGLKIEPRKCKSFFPR